MNLKVREIQVSVDVDATLATYAEIAASQPYRCPCRHCRNFRELGSRALPDDILGFFSSAGISPEFFAEVYEYYETRPGYHLYGGEYYFWGASNLDSRNSWEPSAGGEFSFRFTGPTPLVQEQFSRGGAICFEFVVELPLVLTDAA